MKNKEFEDYLNKIEIEKQKIVSSPEESLKFLVEIGVLTPTGRVKKRYRV